MAECHVEEKPMGAYPEAKALEGGKVFEDVREVTSHEASETSNSEKIVEASSEKESTASGVGSAVPAKSDKVSGEGEPQAEGKNGKGVGDRMAKGKGKCDRKGDGTGRTQSPKPMQGQLKTLGPAKSAHVRPTSPRNTTSETVAVRAASPRKPSEAVAVRAASPRKPSEAVAARAASPRKTSETIAVRAASPRKQVAAPSKSSTDTVRVRPASPRPASPQKVKAMPKATAATEKAVTPAKTKASPAGNTKASPVSDKPEEKASCQEPSTPPYVRGGRKVATPASNTKGGARVPASAEPKAKLSSDEIAMQEAVAKREEIRRRLLQNSRHMERVKLASQQESKHAEQQPVEESKKAVATSKTLQCSRPRSATRQASVPQLQSSPRLTQKTTAAAQASPRPRRATAPGMSSHSRSKGPQSAANLECKDEPTGKSCAATEACEAPQAASSADDALEVCDAPASSSADPVPEAVIDALVSASC